jgi:hypothetical protein
LAILTVVFIFKKELNNSKAQKEKTAKGSVR